MTVYIVTIDEGEYTHVDRVFYDRIAAERYASRIILLGYMISKEDVHIHERRVEDSSIGDDVVTAYRQSDGKIFLGAPTLKRGLPEGDDYVYCTVDFDLSKSAMIEATRNMVMDGEE